MHGRIRERPAPAGGATTTSPHGVRMDDGPRSPRRALDTLRGNADDVPPVARRAWPGGACGGVGRGLTGGARSPGRRRGAARRRVGWGQGGRRGSGQGAGSDRTAPVGRGRARWGPGPVGIGPGGDRARSDRAAAVGQGGQALPAGVLHATGRDARPSRGRAYPCIHAAGVSPRRAVRCHAARGGPRRQAAPLVAGRATPRAAATRAGDADARRAPRLSGPRGRTLGAAPRRSRGITRRPWRSRAGRWPSRAAEGNRVSAGRAAGAMRHACPCKA